MKCVLVPAAAIAANGGVLLARAYAPPDERIDAAQALLRARMGRLVTQVAELELERGAVHARRAALGIVDVTP